MKNNFGNYVVQKALKLARNDNKKKLVANVSKNIERLGEKKLIEKWKNILLYNETGQKSPTFNLNPNYYDKKKTISPTKTPPYKVASLFKSLAIKENQSLDENISPNTSQSLALQSMSETLPSSQPLVSAKLRQSDNIIIVNNKLDSKKYHQFSLDDMNKQFDADHINENQLNLDDGEEEFYQFEYYNNDENDD